MGWSEGGWGVVALPFQRVEDLPSRRGCTIWLVWTQLLSKNSPHHHYVWQHNVIQLCNTETYTVVSKFPRKPGEPRMCKQCVPDAPSDFLSTWECRIPQLLNCFQKQSVGYRVGQGFVSRNASRNTRGRVQGEVLLVLLISCSNKATLYPGSLHTWGRSG